MEACRILRPKHEELTELNQLLNAQVQRVVLDAHGAKLLDRLDGPRPPGGHEDGPSRADMRRDLSEHGAIGTAEPFLVEHAAAVLSVILRGHRRLLLWWHQAPQSTRGAAKSLDAGEAAEPMTRREVRFQRQEAIVTIAGERGDDRRPVGGALTCRHDLSAIGDVLDVNVCEPSAKRSVRIGVGTLTALDEVCRIERGAEMPIIDRTEQVDASENRIGVRLLLVLENQRHS